MTKCSLFQQAQWVKDNNLGGAVVWPLDMDDFSGSFCHQGRFPLTTTLKRDLNVHSASMRLYSYTHSV